jgi:hypothetical protein
VSGYCRHQTGKNKKMKPGKEAFLHLSKNMKASRPNPDALINTISK